jgi:hypothetical protein
VQDCWIDHIVGVKSALPIAGFAAALLIGVLLSAIIQSERVRQLLTRLGLDKKLVAISTGVLALAVLVVFTITALAVRRGQLWVCESWKILKAAYAHDSQTDRTQPAPPFSRARVTRSYGWVTLCRWAGVSWLFASHASASVAFWFRQRR